MIQNEKLDVHNKKHVRRNKGKIIILFFIFSADLKIIVYLNK